MAGLCFYGNAVLKSYRSGERRVTDLMQRVLKLLGENACYSFSEMADMLGEKESAVKAAVEELEKSKAIVKYAAILNTEALPEKNVQALIEVKVAPQKLKGFESCAEEIYNFPEVKSLYLMSGGL